MSRNRRRFAACGLVGGSPRGWVALGLIAVFAMSGCVTPAEHRKLKRKVMALERSEGGSAQGAGLANVSAELQSLKAEIAGLRGQVEVAERKADAALNQAKKARLEVAQGAASDPGEPPQEDSDAPESASAELKSYREAYASARAGDNEVCIDRFRTFLQTYASSPYADDAAYWMADCHYKQKDYRTAVLRFDDVARKYPKGNKAPDALYRQGESLLKLGPGFKKAARRAFERVAKEYPDSARASEAKRQIKLMDAS